MKLYFVRHGESAGNAVGVHQSPQTPLSDIGLDQARFVAHRFSQISVDIIISSDYLRARQTAEAIAETTKKEIILNPSLREIKRSSEIIGKHHTSTISIAIRKQIDIHKHEPEWHYGDEENYFDLYHRAQQFLTEVYQRSEDNVVIVTHSVFLAAIIAAAFSPQNFDVDAFDRFMHFTHSENTAITVLEYKNNAWRLLTWNDYAHLS